MLQSSLVTRCPYLVASEDADMQHAAYERFCSRLLNCLKRLPALRNSRGSCLTFGQVLNRPWCFNVHDDSYMHLKISVFRDVT